MSRVIQTLDPFFAQPGPHNGILNKHNPGPIPVTYVDEVINRLRYFFPDTDFAIGDKYLFVNWC
jgi:hypothetical protein